MPVLLLALLAALPLQDPPAREKASGFTFLRPKGWTRQELAKSPPEEKVSPWHDWIEFTPEGKFKVSGVLKSVAFGDVAKARPPDKAAGTYEIRDWTMFFTFDDGTSWSTDFSILGREMKPDTAILFRTRAYPKAK